MYCTGCTIQRDSVNFGRPCNWIATHVNADNEPVCKQHIKYTKARYEEHIKYKENKLKIEIANQLLLSEHPNDIPYKNFKGEIIGFGHVSEEDYESIMKYKWTIKKKVHHTTGNVIQYLFTHIKTETKQEITKNMHEIILGEPPVDHIIDHIDNNGINNRRENLRFATSSQNSQNRAKKEGTSSKYIGVALNNKKWLSKFSKVYLGSFDNEEDAGRIYDKYVFITLGKDSKTNNLAKYEDITGLTVDDILPKKIKRDLPTNITKYQNKFKVDILYKNKKYTKVETTLDDAIVTLDKFKAIIDDIKKKELEEHYKREILLNENDEAIIPIKDKTGR